MVKYGTLRFDSLTDLKIAKQITRNYEREGRQWRLMILKNGERKHIALTPKIMEQEREGDEQENFYYTATL